MKIVPGHIVEWLKKNGKLYTPALCPADIKRGSVGECFDQSTVVALDGKYHYVEGIALRPGTEDDWILHAWLTDESGKLAYDPTWRAYGPDTLERAVPTTYIGVEMPIEDVARFMLSTRYASLFANAWRMPDLADAACPGIPTERP